MNVLDLFSGIGGFSLGLQWAGGFITKAFCEIDPFCRRVLNKNFPGVKIYEDIRSITSNVIRDECGRIDLITAGFPCQPFSECGKRKGEDDERNMWPETIRLIRSIRPRWALLENVAGLLSSGYFGRVLGDLAECGYDAEWRIIRASEFGLPHNRARLFILAYPISGIGLRVQALEISPYKSIFRRCWQQGAEIVQSRTGRVRLVPEAGISGVDDGLSVELDAIRAIGNAVAPQIVAAIGKAILGLDENIK